MADVAVDMIVDGRYRVAERVGFGGMAEVWCAEDLQLGRRVALKLLHRRFAEDEQFVERFRREASSAAGLQHPNVVGIYDRGEWNGTSYIAMELVEGEPLKDLVQREGPLAPARAIDLVVQVLRAARFAHRRGIVHRDLKPHNVMVDAEGGAKVADFGIARAGASDMTETGSIMGTAEYLSPEQAQGQAVTARSDLYSVGVVLYELLTGRVPFEGETAVTIALRQVAEEPVPPSRLCPGLPYELDAIVLRALAKDPEHRFADADEFIAALEAARARLADGAAPPMGGATAAFVPVADGAVPLDAEPDPEERSRRRWPWILAAAIALLAVLAAVLLLTAGEKRPVPRLIGADAGTAARRLRDDGFRPIIDRQRNAAPRDEVIGQDPGAGTELELGSPVTLTVSDGPGEAAVPDVEQLARRMAERRIERAGFRARIRREASAQVAPGLVIRTNPPGGVQAERGSTVTLFVSTGPTQVTVPSVTGQGLSAARAELEAAGLTATVVQQESTAAEGTVLGQDPGPGQTVDAGSAVTLTVAEEIEEVAVPGVVGRSQTAAVEALSAAGFEVDVQTRSVTAQGSDGVVLSQTPGGGAEARPGATVTIVVGEFSGTTAPPPPDPDDADGAPQEDDEDSGDSGGAGAPSDGAARTP